MKPNVAYCWKCKKQVVMNNPEEVTRTSGSLMLKDTCAFCGSLLLKFMKRINQEWIEWD